MKNLIFDIGSPGHPEYHSGVLTSLFDVPLRKPDLPCEGFKVSEIWRTEHVDCCGNENNPCDPT
jgi:hypothetical protein